MTPNRLVVIGASAGGVEALGRLASQLDADFPAPICIAVHFPPSGTSVLPRILERHGPLWASHARDGMPLEPGHIYIAPPDRHLLVNPDHTLSLARTELVHFVRPSADLLFESVAAAYRARAIAVVLSGTGSDGAMGITAIKKMGGTVIVQEPGSSEFRGMPEAAEHTGRADFVLPLAEIAPAIVALVESEHA